jgi:hypothetical protein
LALEAAAAKAASQERKKVTSDDPELRYLPGMLIRQVPVGRSLLLFDDISGTPV